MKHLLSLGLLLGFLISSLPIRANEPDSVYLFAYSTTRNQGHNGLHFAWSADGKNWQTIGPEFGFLKSDYGRWGSEKRMLTPYLTQGPDGMWHAVWSLNERDHTLAHAASADLVHWKRQAYPEVSPGTCFNPVIRYNKASRNFQLGWLDKTSNLYYQCTTTDFKTFSSCKPADAGSLNDQRVTISLQGETATGTIHRAPWKIVAGMKETLGLIRYNDQLNDERTADDAVRFAGLQPVKATLSVQTKQTKPISNLLTGVFFEDINYAADGGLYAELIQNRDFEYNPADKEGHDARWNSRYAWSLTGEGTDWTIDSLNPVHANNLHYATLKTVQPGAAFCNTGFDGIVVKKGDRYTFSVFAGVSNKEKASFEVQLVSKEGKSCAKGRFDVSAMGWKSLGISLTGLNDANDCHLEIRPLTKGTAHLDMISLFPEKTFKNRKNGLRQDLAQVVADLHPKFIRFPGGCVSHGDGLDNIYRWKTTIGPLEARKPMRNIWNYHQTTGLGYQEYFQYCEDIGAEPLPVLAAGVPCQNSGVGGCGQQGGIPMDQMDEYVQDVLDLIEWANGDAKTTKWGKIRAQNGHPKPFNLKYIGIGNEDLITDVFEERFTMLFNAVKAKHPEITVIGTVGPFFEGTDYTEGWELATKLGVPMVDEHYYLSPGWFINNQDYYDKYDRNKSKVYLGEYAAHLPGRPNNLETALAEALYLTTVERNGDVVSMTSYAPLLAKEGHTQWNPDLIYFNNTEIKPTTGYQVQKLYGQQCGDQYVSNVLNIQTRNEKADKRVVSSVVKDSKTGDLIVRLVNILPVSVSTRIQLDAGNWQPVATRWTLTGKPDGLNLVPSVDQPGISNDFTCEMPPYSFVVYRIKPAKQ